MTNSPKTAIAKSEFLLNARLYVLIDSVDFLETQRCPQLIDLIHQLIESKTSLIQLRDKRLNDRQVIDVGRLIRKLTRDSDTRFIMNDRVDLALATDADGVHLGQEDMLIRDAKEILSPEKIIGISTHSVEQAVKASQTGADYIGVGPVFQSTTKSFREHVGVSLIRDVLASGDVLVPSFAIGGIDLTNVQSLIEIGMCRIAVSGSVARAESPAEAAAALLKKLQSK